MRWSVKCYFLTNQCIRTYEQASKGMHTCRARSGNLQEIGKEIGSKDRIGTFVRMNH